MLLWIFRGKCARVCQSFYTAAMLLLSSSVLFSILLQTVVSFLFLTIKKTYINNNGNKYSFIIVMFCLSVCTGWELENSHIYLWLHCYRYQWQWCVYGKIQVDDMQTGSFSQYFTGYFNYANMFFFQFPDYSNSKYCFIFVCLHIAFTRYFTSN